MRNSIITLFSLLSVVFGSDTIRVAFVGNSYTYSWNLPLLLSELARSTGDSVYTESSTPGGYTFELHTTYAPTTTMIQAGGWDYVVLQEQSQRPSLPLSQVQADVFPYARRLDSMVHQWSRCAETVFFMTWGRKNGDASNCATWPPVCTYSGMDSLLYERYMMMADSNLAIVSPVGAVWKHIRNLYPGLELYQPDESHPSEAGSYAAAVTFYTVLLRKDPTLISYDFSLPAPDADFIRNAVKAVVFDSLGKWHVGMYDPIADFTAVPAGGTTWTMNNTSSRADEWHWDFGDGTTDTDSMPSHSFPPGTWVIRLIASRCGRSDTAYQTISVPTAIIPSAFAEVGVYPNPASDYIQVISAPNTEIVRATMVSPAGSAFPCPIESGRVDLRGFPSGIWILLLDTRDGRKYRTRVTIARE